MKELEALEHLEVLTTTIDDCTLGTDQFLSSHRLMSCIRFLKISNNSNRNRNSSRISLPVTMDRLQEFTIEHCHTSEIKMGRICSFSSLIEVNLSNCRRLRELTFLMFAPNLKRLHDRSELLVFEGYSCLNKTTSDCINFCNLARK